MEVANAGFPEVNPAYEASDRTQDELPSRFVGVGFHKFNPTYGNVLTEVNPAYEASGRTPRPSVRTLRAAATISGGVLKPAMGVLVRSLKRFWQLRHK